MFLITTLVLWATLPIFWGSTLLLENYFYRLDVHVVDFDSVASGADAIAGPYIASSLQAVAAASGPHLNYQVVDPSIYPGGPSQVMEAVKHSGPWAAVVIFNNATSSYRNAITTGDAAYDPSGTVGIYYSGARFYQIVLLFIVPLLEKNVYSGLSTAAQAASQQFLCGATATAGALTTAGASPQAIGNAFGYFLYDVNPITAWASAAPMEAGLIYLTIFTFHYALISFFGRTFSGLQNKLKFWNLVGMRLTSCAVMYFFLALWYACLNRAFQEPLQSSVGKAGFVVLWMLTWITLFAVGLAMESMISLLTPRFFPFFLIFWIITNLSSSFLPLELMQRFYWWGYGWPFYQNVQATKIIMYGNQPTHILGRYFGVLIAWAVVNVVALILCSWVERRRGDRGARRQIEEKQAKEREQQNEKA